MEDTDGGNSGSLIHNQDEEAFSLLELRPSQISSHISISVDGRPLRISSPTLLGMLTQFGEWVEQIVLRERESNSDSNYTGMRELCIEFPDLGLWGYRPEADVMIYLMAPAAEVIRSSPSLSKLNLRYSHKLATIEVQALARALKESSSLRIIQIEGLEEGMAAVLLDAFPSEGSDLGKLILKGHQWEGSRVLISHILNANILHVEIFLGIYVQPEIGPPEFLNEPHTFPWEEIGRALLQVSILKKLSLDIWVPVGREQEDVDSRSSKWKTFLNGVKKMWEESQQSPLIDLSLFFSVQPNNRDQCLVSSVLLSLAGLKGVHLTVIPHLVSASDDTGIKRVMMEVTDTLNQIEYLETCTLRFVYPGAGMQMLPTLHPSDLRRIIFQKLSDNSSIKELTLHDSFFEEITQEDFKEVLKCLARNCTLQRVDIGYEAWIHDGKVARIREALERNVRQAQDMSMMRQAGLQFSVKTAGRILLCGSPYAGKTRLRKTLLRTEIGGIHYMFNKGLNALSSMLPAQFGLPRTKGIEVTTLRDDAEISITVWDLGGQLIFRALQDLLFPRTSHACIYLFLFSPVERVRGKVRKKDDLPSSLKQELKSWLRFIASNSSSATAGLLPQVMIVISHKDKLPSCDRDLSWAGSVVDRLKTSFQGVISLCSSQEIQFINCHNPRDVSALKEYIFRQMDIVFIRSLVPSVGIAVTTLLTRRPREVREYPVWSLKELHTYICNQDVGRLNNPNLDTAIRTRVLEAVVGYLHDVGSIIIISHLVVVDPNWMTEKFLGELFSHGHDFEAGRSVVYPGSLGRDGFIDSQTLSGFLATFVAHYQRGGIHVSADQLKGLLLELNLCFELDAVENPGNPRYFMPAVLVGAQEKLPARKLEWKFDRPEGAEHFGFRLQCDYRDRKCLTKAFFPTFQVKLRNYLLTHLRMDVTAVRCSLGLMTIHEDGNEIFVESDELAEDHIDIMVRSSPDRKEMAIQFVEEKIISFLYGICKSDFAGISLSTNILRTECVVKLTPRDHRTDNQAISVRELEEKLEEQVKSQWELLAKDGTPGQIPNTWIESCLKYKHTWPGITCENSGVDLPAAPEPIQEFLSRKVLNKIRKNLTKIARRYDWSRSESRKTANEVRRLNDEVFEVYAPVGDNPRVEVVFVHGVPEDESDPEPYLTTWSKNNQDPDKCWLNTWLTSENTEDLRLARILTVTYDCGVRKTDQSGNMDNFLVAENLTQSLITLARVGQHDCPVVLVGHCLGGLVIKEVCSEASRSVGADHRRATEFHNFLTNVKGLFFYSTPHLGWSRNFPSELQRADMMESLEVLSKYTSRVNHHFEQLRKKYHWRTRGVGESNKTRIFSPKDGESTTLTELVVEEASARGGSSEFSMVSDTDHFTICRPKSKESNSFLYLVEFIEYLLTETATKAP